MRIWSWEWSDTSKPACCLQFPLVGGWWVRLWYIRYRPKAYRLTLPAPMSAQPFIVEGPTVERVICLDALCPRQKETHGYHA